MKQLPSIKPVVTRLEIAVVALLAVCALLAVVQGLGMIGAGIAATENAAPVR